jgi:hypothetical protein
VPDAVDTTHGDVEAVTDALEAEIQACRRGVGSPVAREG